MEQQKILPIRLEMLSVLRKSNYGLVKTECLMQEVVIVVAVVVVVVIVVVIVVGFLLL